MNQEQRLQKLKEMPVGADYFFAVACHKVLLHIERFYDYRANSISMAKAYKTGIAVIFNTEVHIKNNHLTL
jgi:hypothetical protein